MKTTMKRKLANTDDDAGPALRADPRALSALAVRKLAALGTGPTLHESARALRAVPVVRARSHQETHYLLLGGATGCLDAGVAETDWGD